MSLTGQDKQWIVDRLAESEARFADRLERVEAIFADGLAKTEARFADRLGKVEANLKRVEAIFADGLAKAEARFADRLEKVETSLLTEFHKWASPVEMRQRTHSAAIRALDVEVESIAERLSELEKSNSSGDPAA